MLGIRRIDKVLNAQIRELCRMMKGADKRIDKGVLQWFSHAERIENDRIAKRVNVGECVGSHSMDRPQKRCIDAMKECLKKMFRYQARKENGA